MGIRSILGIGKGKKSEGGSSSPEESEDGEAEDAVVAADAVSGAPTASSPVTPPAATEVPFQQPLRMGEDPVSKEVNVLSMDHKESTQERINRVKSGLMTEAEKKAFLQTALTAGNTAESRRPLRDESAVLDSAGSSKKRFFASPFPSDSILRNFARGGKNASDNVAELDMQKKKREYLDMVTSPDRFHVYRANPSGSPPSSPSKTPIPDLRSMELKTSQPASSPIDSVPPSAPLPSDLGARLGVAAMASESLRQQQEQERRKELQEKMDLDRRQYEQRAVDLRDWQVQMASFEMQQRELRIKEEQSRLKEEESKREAEKARLDALMKAQEDYWSKKLAAEKASRIKQFESDEDSAEKATASQPNAVEEEIKLQSEPEAGKVVQPIFNPDEHELLELAKKDRDADWGGNQEKIEETKARTLGVMPIYTAIETEKDFLAEQARKKQAIERQREEQMKRLKAMSSPLPSPTPVPRPPPPVFRPQAVSGPAAPLFGRDAVEGTRRPLVRMTDTPAPDAAPISPPQVNSAPSSIPVPTSGKSMWSSFLGGDVSSNPTSTQTPPQSKAPASKTSASKVPASKAPTSNVSAKSGPIRMKLPLGDDEDGVDVRSNQGMSIAEAMKKSPISAGNASERSKKWGIDMSKFSDDKEGTR